MSPGPDDTWCGMAFAGGVIRARPFWLDGRVGGLHVGSPWPHEAAPIGEPRTGSTKCRSDWSNLECRSEVGESSWH